MSRALAPCRTTISLTRTPHHRHIADNGNGTSFAYASAADDSLPLSAFSVIATATLLTAEMPARRLPATPPRPFPFSLALIEIDADEMTACSPRRNFSSPHFSFSFTYHRYQFDFGTRRHDGFLISPAHIDDTHFAFIYIFFHDYVYFYASAPFSRKGLSRITKRSAHLRNAVTSAAWDIMKQALFHAPENFLIFGRFRLRITLAIRYRGYCHFRSRAT